MYQSILGTAAILLFQITTAATQNIGQQTFNFKDEHRNRPVITEVWYPTTDPVTTKDAPDYPYIHVPTVRNGKVPDQKMALILLSHGTGGGRITLEWLADKLVQNGFMVAAVDHYGNTFNNKIPEDFVEPWQRPQDISFALTCLLKDNVFGKLIDTARIGAAGFSFGGYTVIGLAGAVLDLENLKSYFKTERGRKSLNVPEFPNLLKVLDTSAVIASFKTAPPLKDSRIKAFFAMAPGVGDGFTSKKQFTDVTAPVYIIDAQSDSIAPAKTNAIHFHELIKGSQLKIIKGKAGHYVFLNEARDQLKKEAPVQFIDDPSVNRHQIHEEAGQLAVDFFKSNLK